MKTHIHKNESGLASLVIAILIVIIVTTLVLGFMQIIRREQRRSLDHQLSSQAYYAAESGVNDAVKAIEQQGYVADKTSCGPLLLPAALSSNTLSSDVHYSCLLIEQSPTSIQYDKVSITHSSVFPMTSASGLASATFTWQNPDGNTSNTRNPSVSNFPPMTIAGNWDSLGLLRVDIMPAGSLARASLISGARTYFMYPNRGGGGPVSIDYTATANGSIINGKCSNIGGPNGSHVCSVRITGLPAGALYARVIAMYAPVKLTVTGIDSVGAAAQFNGAQAVIDSTGKAADVLRRIRVRIPHHDIDMPEYAIASMDSLCKKFTVDVLGTLTVDPSASDPACNPN